MKIHRLFFLICALLALLTSIGCKTLNRGWSRLSSEDDYMLLALDESSGVFWVAKLFDHQVGWISISDPNPSISMIDLPARTSIWRMCAASGLYVIPVNIDASPETMQVLMYGADENEWVQYSTTELGGVPYCKSTRQYGVISGGEEKLLKMEAGKLVQIDPRIGPMGDFVVDMDGKIWLLTRDGLIYEQTAQKEWSLWNAQRGYSLYSTGTDALWLSNTHELYHWNTTQEGKPTLVFQAKEEIIIGVYPDLVVTNKGVWLFRGTVQTNSTLRLPLGVTKIWATAFDHKLKRLYISTNGGLYFMDADVFLAPSTPGSN